MKFYNFVFFSPVCLYGLFMGIPPANAQQPDSMAIHTIQEVVISEKRRPPLIKSSAPLQIIDRETIQQMGVQDLSDAARRFSGVTVKDYGGIGGFKTISVRSLGAQHTAVSYDGVPVSNCQSGQIDLSRFSLDNVASLALSVGQTDQIFQTARMFASAGALSIRTQRPSLTDKHYRANVQLKSGSFGLLNTAARYEQKLGKNVAATINADWMRADGQYPFTLVNGNITTHEKRTNTDIDTWRTEVNVYTDLPKGGRLDTKLYYFDSQRGLPGSIVLYNPYTKERLWDRNFFGQAYYENQLNTHFSLQANARYNWSYTKHVDVNDKYEEGRQLNTYYQREYYVSATALYMPARYWSFSLASDFFINKLRNNFPDCPFPSRYSSLTVAAGKYENSFFTASGSILGTYVREEVRTGSSHPDRKHLSPALSLSIRPFAKTNLRIRLSFKDIFRLPTFNDMYYKQIGNSNLKPETARQFNLGMAWSGRPLRCFNYMHASVDGYYNRVSDKIVAVPTMFIWEMKNLGEVNIGGADVNVGADIALCRHVSILVQGAYTYQYAVDITNTQDKNYKDQIPYTPRHSGSGSATLKHRWLNVTYSLVGAGIRYINPQNTEKNKMPSYIEHTLSANRTFRLKNSSLRAQAEIVNLTDKQYDIVKYYPMPGRSFRCSVTFTF